MSICRVHLCVQARLPSKIDDAMESLVYLAHRMPYPPNKGDKIRSYHMLRFLAARYRVHVGTFVDDEDDWRHVPVLEQFCQEVFAVGLHPTLQRVVFI